MYALIPPASHRLAGHELFDFAAERYFFQPTAAVECMIVYHLDGGGDLDAFK
jgi:hypothetical protein